jgi:hypothetical protein
MLDLLAGNSRVILGVPRKHWFLLIMILIFVERLVMLCCYLLFLLKGHVFAVTFSLTGNLFELCSPVSALLISKKVKY